MKKIFLGVLALLVSASVFAERVTVDDAALVANHFMNIESASVAGVKKAPAKQMVRKATAEDAQYYVYENANGEGWVIVAANDVVTPILAYSETGRFRTDNLPVNIRKWMGKYNNYINRLEKEGVVASEEAKAEWKALRQSPRKGKGDAVVGPLVQTTWDQDEPFNDLCPGTGSNKAYTGCVATAMAQVMNYWQWPVKGTGSHSYKPLDPNDPQQYSSRYKNTLSANFGETTYDWANMKNSYKGSYSDAQGTAVATLMYHCGVATEMMYGNDADGGSGTFTVNYGDWSWGISTTDECGCAQNALATFFGYKKETLTGYMRDGYKESGVTYYEKWSDADWTAMVKEELDKRHPIMYGGASNEGGHSFICDGYDDADYFHFNWGWSGDNDGYYKLSNLKPGSGGAGGGGYDFSEDQDVIIGIVPDRKDLPKVTVTWSVQGVTTTTEFTQEDPLVLPAAPAACSDTRVFVGWTAQSTVSGDKPADLFTKAGSKTVTEAVTYYAVFADKEGEGAEEQTNTYTFTSKSWADATNSWTSTKDAGQYTTDKNGVQVSKTYTGAGAQTKNEFTNVSKVVVTYCTNASAGAGSITISIGSDSKEQNVTKTGGAELRNLEYTFSNASGKVNFVVACTTNSIYINSIAITSGGNISYSNYGLYCGSEDVENVRTTERANKVIENGQLIIIRGDEKYSIFGQKIQ